MMRSTFEAKTPREHFMRAVHDELSKFERKERAFRKAERAERAAQLRLAAADGDIKKMFVLMRRAGVRRSG
jgi:hypothetical protein